MGEIFLNNPDRLWGLDLFQGVEQIESHDDHLHMPSAEF
jgi:hypothetical protein